VLPLITVPYISRVLGAENIGIYSYTFSITTYFIYFAMLGIITYGNRTIAIVRDNKEKLNQTFTDLFCLHLGISVVVLFAYMIFCFIIAEQYKSIFSIQIFLIFAALLNINWLFTGLEQFRLTVARSAIIKIISVICVFVFVRGVDDLWKYALIMSLGEFFSQAILWIIRMKYVSFVKPTWSGVSSHIKPMCLLFIPVIAISIYRVMDKIMLGIMSEKTQLGFYENSDKIIVMILGFIFAFNNVMIPRISNITAKGNLEEKMKLMHISMRYVILFAFALSFGIASISNDFASLFFGREFKDSGVLLAGLCITIPFIAFGNVIYKQHLIPNSKDKIITIIFVIGALVNIISNLILIPRFEAMGAVIGTIIVEIIVCILMVFASRKSLPILDYMKTNIIFFFAGIAMYFLVRFIGTLMKLSVYAILIQICIGAIFYISITLIYLYKTKDETFINNVYKRIVAFKNKN